VTLDLAKVSPQLRRMSQRLHQRREELHRRLELARGTLMAWSDRWPELRDLAESRQRNQRLASPREPLAFRGPLPEPPPDHRVVATDGSQIEPDRHGPAEYFLINIGQVVLRYGIEPTAMLASQPRLAYETRDLFVTAGDGRRRVPIQGSHLASLRAVEELQAAVQLAAEAADILPQVVLQDGTLLLWVLEERPDDFLRDAFLQPYGQALADCQQLGQPLASYISRPRSAEVVALLRAATCGGEPVDCARLHPLSTESDATDEPPCALDGLHDRRLFEHLQHGERSGLFATTLHETIEKYYLGQRIHFFFLNVGSELARVEIPEWVAEDSARLDLVHAVVFDQCRRGQGYPVALTRAHEQALVRGADRAMVRMLLESLFAQQGIRTSFSEKEAAKRLRAV
jgi:GNAT superfamily N-acetyltransferase